MQKRKNQLSKRVNGEKKKVTSVFSPKKASSEAKILILFLLSSKEHVEMYIPSSKKSLVNEVMILLKEKPDNKITINPGKSLVTAIFNTGDAVVSTWNCETRKKAKKFVEIAA